MLQNTLINHVSLVVDKSGSMSIHANKVVEVFDRELNYLKQRSIDLNQETRISIYLFDDKIEVLTFDMDVMRFNSLKGFYRIGGQTALVDATFKSIEDNRKLPELYGDHAFLQYVITDGQENASRRNTRTSLSDLLLKLPDNWTTAILVPDKQGESFAQQFGFNAGSIAIWDTTQYNALDGVGKHFSRTIDNYMAMRATGVRGTKTLFTLDPSGLKKSALQELSPNLYHVYNVIKDYPIREYVQDILGKNYNLGLAYYQPTKTVTIQDHKKILVQEVKTGKVYEGSNIRQLLGLPNDTVNVSPSANKDWRIFVQSTSVNRKLFAGTYLLLHN